MKRPIRKRSFLLFELLIALILMVICFFPLIHTHMGIRREKVKFCHEFESVREAQNAFCLFKQALFEHQIDFNELYRKGEKEFVHPENKIVYRIKYLDHSHKNNSKDAALVLSVKFKLEEKGTEFTRSLYIRKLG